MWEDKKALREFMFGTDNFENICSICEGTYVTDIPLDDDIRKVCDECEKDAKS